VRDVLSLDHPDFPKFCRRLAQRIGTSCTGALDASVDLMIEMGFDPVASLEALSCKGIFRDCEVRNPPEDPPKSPLFLVADDDEPEQEWSEYTEESKLRPRA
jgi:hypothetical protein